MAKRKRTNSGTTIYYSLPRKLKIEQPKLRYTIYFEIIINDTTVVYIFFFSGLQVFIL